MPRNTYVEAAVDRLLSAVDAFAKGERRVQKFSPAVAELVESICASARASVRLAEAFFVFYWLEDRNWDVDTIPIGIRGTHGDKKLAEELKRRDIKFHDGITAFGENLGWKGNVKAARIRRDTRFGGFSDKFQALSAEERQMAADLLASRIAESKYIRSPLPPIDAAVLSFARARILFESLLGQESAGHIQQLLVAALLKVHRSRYQIEIRTHQTHAADTYDQAAGDIEEWHGDLLVRAYEVTMRPDWKNRLDNFRSKMDKFKLRKYAIVAASVDEDADLREPARMLKFLEPIGRDLAVIDIQDFCDFMAMELSADELRSAVNFAFELLKNPSISGRTAYVEKYETVVKRWLTAT